MITETRINYVCEFCRKRYVLKHMAESHEKGCSKNPENKHACFNGIDCANLIKGKSRDDCKFYCSVRNIELYTYRAESSSVMQYLEDAERMPKECEQYACACDPCKRKMEGKPPLSLHDLQCSLKEVGL